MEASEVEAAVCVFEVTGGCVLGEGGGVFGAAVAPLVVDADHEAAVGLLVVALALVEGEALAEGGLAEGGVGEDAVGAFEEEPTAPEAAIGVAALAGEVEVDGLVERAGVGGEAGAGGGVVAAGGAVGVDAEGLGALRR